MTSLRLSASADEVDFDAVVARPVATDEAGVAGWSCAELATWERKYGAAWRVRHNAAAPDEVDELTADVEIPDPPGLEAVEERARRVFGAA